MSLKFSDTSTKKGIIQEIESECGFNDGDISGNTVQLKKFTALVNLALDDFFARAIRSSGKWQLDDSNYTDYPVMTTDIVSGQRDYAFTTDEDGNFVLDVYKVLVANSGGIFTEVTSVDQQEPSSNIGGVSTFLDGQNSSGIPTRHDKTANAIFLDPIPNYNRTAGLKLLINREGSYFAYTDTTKTPGVPGVLHRYFVLKPSQDHIRRHGTTADYNKITAEVLKMEQVIDSHFSARERGIRRNMRANSENNK